MTKRQRIFVSATVGVALWFLGWGTLGYFVGLVGVGFGWPAFWSVGVIALAPLLAAGVIGGFISLAVVWIGRAEK